MKSFVYILSNTTRKVFYIGVTSNLTQRLEQHKINQDPKSFTKKYNAHELIYYEEFDDIKEAIKREKQLKGWNRNKKYNLIKKVNPKLQEITLEE